MSTSKDQGLRVKASPYFKLKKEKNKNYQGINLLKQFGFIPENIIIERMSDRNNVVRVIAVLTDAEIKKENSMLTKKIKDKSNG